MPKVKKGKINNSPTANDLKIRCNYIKYDQFLKDRHTTSINSPDKQDKEYIRHSLRSFVPRLKRLFSLSTIQNYQSNHEEHDDNGWYKDSYREINGGRFEMKLFCSFIDKNFGSQFATDLSMYAKRLALQDKRVNALPNQFFTE